MLPINPDKYSGETSIMTICKYRQIIINNQRTTITIHPRSGWFYFFGHSPNTTSCTQVCLLLACQPCEGLLATRKRVSRIEQT